MPVIETNCGKCGRPFEPDRRAIVPCTWRICPTCQSQRTEETRCERCGRPLRAGPRTLCLGCATGGSLL